MCVCHLQDVLGEPQVKVSKHLAYLRARGIVTVQCEGNWRVYSLVATPPRSLKSNLACLQDCVQEDPVFRQDKAKLKKLQANSILGSPACCK